MKIHIVAYQAAPHAAVAQTAQQACELLLLHMAQSAAGSSSRDSMDRRTARGLSLHLSAERQSPPPSIWFGEAGRARSWRAASASNRAFVGAVEGRSMLEMPLFPQMGADRDVFPARSCPAPADMLKVREMPRFTTSCGRHIVDVLAEHADVPPDEVSTP